MTTPTMRPEPSSAASDSPKIRQRRRSMAAVIAAMLLASLLAVIVGSPAQAANTAAEYLYDHDDDSTTREIRQFGGTNRYDTALRLANAYSDEQGGLGSIQTVIIASGVSLIDAVTSASLAAANTAPVLLTGNRRLDRSVARFIEEQGTSQVIVAGGPAAVPETILDQLRGLETEPEVIRLFGADRAATAVDIAEELFSPASWCGTSELAAILANGEAPDAIAAGPLSYVLQMPILLTEGDTLSTPTADYLDESEIERLIVLGGPSVISSDVTDEVESLGITVERIGGDTLDTSVELTRLMTSGACSDDVGAATDVVALINASATADGVAAAPVLGAGINGSGPIPVLFTSDTLPDRVRSYLAATPTLSGTDKTHLGLLAIGGTAVVSNAVMNAAVNAASTAGSLGITIKPVVLPTDPNQQVNTFTLQFTDALGLAVSADGTNNAASHDADDETFKTALRSLLFVNSVPASVDTATGGNINMYATQSTGVTDSCGTSVEVIVTLTHRLREGDVISVRGSSYLFGTNGDQRPVSGASHTVRAPTRVSTPPALEVFAVPGRNQMMVIVTSTGAPDNSLTDVGDLDLSKVSVTSAAGTTVGITETDDEGTAGVTSFTESGTTYTVSPQAARVHRLRLYNDANDNGEKDSGEANYTLSVRDSVTLASGAVRRDTASSRTVRKSVTASTASIRATSVRMSSADPGFAGNPGIEPDAMNFVDIDGNGEPSDGDTVISRNARWNVAAESGGNAVTVNARWTGDASGAAGNGWLATTSQAFDFEDNNEVGDGPAEISVAVNARNKVISIRYMYGTPTRAELQQALNGNEAFAENFYADTPCTGATTEKIVKEETTKKPLPTVSPNPAAESAGRSSVLFQVNFNDYVNVTVTESGESQSNLVEDLFSSLLPNYATTDLANSFESHLRWRPTIPIDTTDPGGNLPINGLSSQVYVRYYTDNAAKLPTTRSGAGRGVITFEGDARGTDDDGDEIARGYAGNDASTTDIDERLNQPSQPRVSFDRNLLITD